MNFDDFTHGELHSALSQLILSVQIAHLQIKEILANTDKFDAALSMEVVDNISKGLQAANDLLMDSYRNQGLSDEAIQARIEHWKKMLGFDS